MLPAYNCATGAEFQAEMLCALGVDNSTRLFELAGARFVAALLKALGPDFNAVLVNDLGKGAVLLGIDLGASFLAEVSGTFQHLQANSLSRKLHGCHPAATADCECHPCTLR